MLFQCDFHSAELGMATRMNIIMPQKMSNVYGVDEKETEVKDIPVLYLLHGCSDDQSIWCRRTSIERYAAEYNLAIVMPCGARSFYTDMAHGQKWFSFIACELPELIENYFPVSRKREDTFIAGLSMGGYGAFKIALKRPDKFGAAASLSGAVDMGGWSLKMESESAPMVEEMKNIYGDIHKIYGSEEDIFALSDKVVKGGGPRPDLFQICGTEDFLYEDNIRLRNHLDSIDYGLKYFEEPGIHCWAFWDRNIQKVLKWLPLAENK